ncbi:MAG TPA: winged helix DNA-binding domain-containing protein [Puia sp.]|nr:winged helix DNA-binding domain-containing protein [Puia sp.]
MNSSQILQYRLYNQHLTENRFRSPAELVSHLGAVQAQDYAAAKWAIGLRLPGSTDEDIEQSIAKREIIRTWSLRGTLHFVAPADLRWILDLINPRLLSAYAGHFRRLGLEKTLIRKSHNTMANALRDGNQLTRKELADVLERYKIPTHDMRMNFLLLRAALDGLICLGERHGKQFTYTLLDEWIPSTRKLAREEAITQLAKRYFASHGPATIQDFAWWSGLNMADVKMAIELIGPGFRSEKIGQSIFWCQKDLSGGSNRSSIHLLPSFDEYIVGYADRSATLGNIPFRRILNGSLFYPVVIINGKIVGTWKRTFKKNAVMIESNFFDISNRSQLSRIAATSRKYGKFLGMNTDLRKKK